MVQVRRLGAELDASVFSVKAKNKLRARLAALVQKVLISVFVNRCVYCLGTRYNWRYSA